MQLHAGLYSGRKNWYLKACWMCLRKVLVLLCSQSSVCLAHLSCAFGFRRHQQEGFGRLF
jgi:hypothetical protein